MTRTTRIALAVVVVLAATAGTAAAAPAAQHVDAATERAPADGEGPPGFLGDLLDRVVPDFVGDLLDALPVPEFLKDLF